MKKRLSLLAVLAAVAACISAGNALAYGHKDNPIAQVEISGNCNNATLCPSLIGGEGGFWVWAELDDTSGNGTSGTTDFTFAGCGHNVGQPAQPGRGNAGAGGGPGEGTWQKYNSLFDAVAAIGIDQLFPVAIVLDKTGQIDQTVPYYVLDMPGGSGGPDTFFAVPAEYGHYSLSGLQLQINDQGQVTGIIGAPGISVQTQVAP